MPSVLLPLRPWCVLQSRSMPQQPLSEPLSTRQACENRFQADFSPLSSCRSPQAALNLSYRSDSVTRGMTCGTKSTRRNFKSGTRIVLDGP